MAADETPAGAVKTPGGSGDGGGARTGKTASRKKTGTSGKAHSKTTARKKTAAAGDKDGKNTTRRKTAEATKKPGGKGRKRTTTARSKPAAGQVAARPQETEADLDAAAVTSTPAQGGETAAEVADSIAWMSRRAVSALNAVRANQAKKAEALLAKVEKPVPGRPGITELPEQTSEDLLEEIIDQQTIMPPSPHAGAQPENATPGHGAETARNQRANPTTEESTVMPEKPDLSEGTPRETEIPANASDTAQDTAAVTGAEPGPAEEVATPAVAETAAADGTESAAGGTGAAPAGAMPEQRGLPARAVVLTVFIAILAYTGYRYWQEAGDDAVTAPPASGADGMTLQEQGWEEVTRQKAVSVVGGGAETIQPAPAPGPVLAPAAPRTTATATTQTGTQAPVESVPAPEPAPAAQSGPPATAEPPPGPKTAVATPSQEAATPPEPAPEPVQSAGTEPEAAPPQPATPAPQAAPAAQPQRYAPPGYGYYPQQPNWQQQQQRYYPPGYPQQYPSR